MARFRMPCFERAMGSVPAAPAVPQPTGGYTTPRPFMIRLKHSLRDAREMLSNTVAFWMVQALADKGWDPAAVDVPGLTAGLPSDTPDYPEVTLK